MIAVNLGSTRAKLAIPRHLDVTARVVLATAPARIGNEINQYANLEPKKMSTNVNSYEKSRAIVFWTNRPEPLHPL